MGLVGMMGVAQAEIKIGFVNAEKLLQEAPQADSARARLEQEFAPRDKKLAASTKQLRALEEKLTRDGATMADAERTKLEREARDMKRDLKREQDEFREDFNIRRNEELGKLQKQVFEAIRTLAKGENYDLILSEGVIAASKQVDITSKVLELLKK
jgi:outer membrane protein